MNYHKIKYSLYILSFFLILVFAFPSCYEYPDLSKVSYNEFRRVIGPDGGEINFYNSYENDAVNDVLVSMEFPAGAVDSFTVFNMYEFYSEPTYNDLYLLNRFPETKFLYFVPFKESEGYNEHTDQGDTIHLSVFFNNPVTIAYNLDYFTNEDLPVAGTSRLYRIKIPELNEWDEDVWVEWNTQGYPFGYDNTDLSYLINGRWTETADWGSGDLSLVNWEEIVDYTYSSAENTISFDILSTDYMYVMAK